MKTATLAPTPCRAALLCGLALAASACKSRGDESPLSHAEPTEDAFANVPAPSADGPKLVALREATVVYERPSVGAKKLGELRVGTVLARSKDAYTKTGCEGGWFAVRPSGFVCADGVALDLAAASGLPAAPDLARALPYRYARARSENVPLYAHVPTPAEQAEKEPDLAKVRAREPDKDPLGASPNDVPLDPRGVAVGPPVLLPGGEGIIDGRRTGAGYFQFASDAPPPVFPASAGLKPGALRKGSGIAVTGTFLAESGSGPRRFAVTVDGHVVPVDRLRPALGSVWHGFDLEKSPLPMAFVHKTGVHTFALAHGKAAKRDDELERRTAVPLSGKFRTVDSIRYEETRDGAWLRAQDLVVIVKRHKLPDFAKGAQKWLDVSIANQTMTAYEGSKPVYATLISTGRDLLKDPQTSASTPRGTFRVTGKHVTRAVDTREVQNAFDVADAPWVLEAEGGFAITGMYWGDGVGEAQGFHDIALTPIDAHRIWSWSDPQPPEGWHGLYDASGADGGERGTIVSVRP